VDEGQFISVILDLFRPSGGGVYHLRSLRRQALWKPFRQQLNHWLSEWLNEILASHLNPRPESLILIGPSGGYTLETEWLNRFSSISAYDIDPLAPWFFRRRHPAVAEKTKFHRLDVFWAGGRLSLSALGSVLNQYPSSAILFSNVLGQVPLEHPVAEDEWRSYLKTLSEKLRSRSWASYHDLYSLDSLKANQHANVFEQLHTAKTAPNDLRGVKTSVVVTDHLLDSDWTSGLKTKRFAWSLSSKSLHIIEGVHN
jgi:hypothetical protein